MTQLKSEVVVTGVGVVSPIGIGRSAFWTSLQSGRSGIEPLSISDMGTLPMPYGGQLFDFDPKKYVKPRKAIKMMCREVQVGQAAACLALEDGNAQAEALDADRFGIVFGSEMLYGHPSGLREVFAHSLERNEISFARWGDRFSHEMFPLWLLLYLPNMVACHAAIALDARGPNNTIVQGATSGLLSVIEAATYIERGWADIMLAGGCGTTISPTHQVYLTHDNLSKQSDGKRSVRPFDANRDGFVVGEGGAAVLLESREHAANRGAKVLASLVGMARTVGLADARFGGATIDATRRSITKALAALPEAKSALQHVSANGLATIDDDRREAQAISECVGDVPVLASKSYFGNLGAGASAVELAASVLALHEGLIPPTLNYETPDPTCPINVAHGEPAKSDLPLALALSQSTTGQAAAIALKAER